MQPRVGTFVLALFLSCFVTAQSLRAQEDPIAAALAEPASARFDAAAGTLKVVYGIDELLKGTAQVRGPQDAELRAPRAGELAFHATTEGGAQRWKLELAAGAGLDELALACEVRASDEAIAVEAGVPSSPLKLVRRSLGQSYNLRNDAVYDRHWDWLLSGPSGGATRIEPQKRQAGATHFKLVCTGASVELVFRPLYLRSAQNPQFAPWKRSAAKETLAVWSGPDSAADATQALTALHLDEFGVRVGVADAARPPDAPKSASEVSLAGGTLWLREPVGAYRMPAALEVLKRALPILSSVPGRAQDLVAAEQPPGAWRLLEIDRPFERWNVLARFGAQAETRVSFADLGFPPDSEQLVYEFTTRRFLGAARGSFTAPALAADGQQIFALRTRVDRPQLLSTSRHITQGAAELSELTWNADKLTLEGVSKLIADDPYELVLHVPPGYTAQKARIGVTDVEIHADGPLVRLDLTPVVSQLMFWTISFRKS